MFVRLAFAVGCIGMLAFLLVAGSGYALAGASDERVPAHYVGAVLAILPLLFVDFWAAVYFLASARQARRLARRFAVDPRPALRAREIARKQPPWLFAAALLVVAAVATGGLAFTAHLPAWLHHLTFVAAVATQLAALLRLRGAFARHTAAFATLDDDVGERERRLIETAALSGHP